MQNQQQPTAPTSNPNPQPKVRFQLSPDNVRKHRDLVDMNEFQRGADFAMLQFSGWLATQVSDNTTAMAAGYQLMGAHAFIATFKALAETPPAPVRVMDTSNLNHKLS